MFLQTLIPAIISASLLVPASPPSPERTVDPTMNLVEVAASSGSFNTLVTAVKAAGLVEILSSDGPFTVFAPSDDAFSLIPAEKLQQLLSDKEALRAVLTYHVVPGKVYAKEVMKLHTAETVNGQSIQVRAEDGSVMIDEATVISVDIEATNGVIHVIDRVILPEM